MKNVTNNDKCNKCFAASLLPFSVVVVVVVVVIVCGSLASATKRLI